MQNMSKGVKISSMITPTAGASGSSDINGSTLDMSNFEAVLMEIRLGAIEASCAISIKAQQGDESDLSDASDLEGTSVAVAVTDDEKTKFLDLVKPTKRYVRGVVLRATGNGTVAGASYKQYGPKKKPVTQGTNVAGETHVSPDEGTA